MFTPHVKLTLPTMSDIVQGAEVYLNAAKLTQVTPVERAAYAEFMEAYDVSVDNEWLLHVFALLATSQHREAMDFINECIEKAQPEPDAFGDAADRGNDERGM